MLSARPRRKDRTLRASARDVLLTIAILLAVPFARAGDVDAARKTFAKGVKLYQKGDYEGARRLFREADAEHHAAPIVYNLALAEEKLGRPQAAVDAYEAYVAEVGEKGALAPAAALAIAQIKARSTKLRIETKPPGARVFVDGAPLDEPAPTSVLVTGGHHVVVVQGAGWRAEEDVTTAGKGDSQVVTLAAAAAPALDRPTAPPSPARAPSPETTPASVPPRSEGVIWGAAFAAVPAYLFGVDTRDKTIEATLATTNARDASSIVAGPLFEVGYALSPDLLFLGRALVGIGPDAKPVAYAFMGGPGLSARVAKRVWLGGTFIGGQLETAAYDARYGTDVVFGGMLEANVIVISKPDGEWIAGVSPGVLLTRRDQDNPALLIPLTFGYRAF